MSSFVRTKIKLARECISKKDFSKARDAAADALSYEPENYHANVFLALSLSELGKHDESEQAYQKAIESSPDQLLAWQGIYKLYERREHWDNCLKTLEKLMSLYAKSDDTTKCAEAVQRYVALQRQEGSRSHLITALHYLLPDSPYYHILSNLQPPDPSAPTATTTFEVQSAVHNSLPIIEEIVELTEKSETERSKSEFEKRRTRLGAGSPAEVKREVNLEICKDSKLPDLYNEVLSHPNTSDERRRTVEAKLLRFKHQYLCALPSSSDAKRRLANDVQTLIDGVILLNIPDEFAWTLYIEGRNTYSIDGYDFGLLRRFMALFSHLPLSNLIRGYFLCNDIPLEEEDSENNEEQKKPDNDVDHFELVVDSYESVPDSIIAHRLLGDLYVKDEDYENAIAVVEKGLPLSRRFESENGVPLDQVRNAFNVMLGTGLVHLYPPKHHARAIRILDEVLAQDQENIVALMGRGFIAQTSKKWTDANVFFSKVYVIASEENRLKYRALEERAWCRVQESDLDTAEDELQQVLTKFESPQYSADTDLEKARVRWRLGECLWHMGEESREGAYKQYITALKCSPSYAPAFTSLGIYYLECASPPDPNRAAKCFQKAFELDARETDAARRLAHSFAEEREWDLVEVVAKRTIEGEGGGGDGSAGSTAKPMVKHQPMNAWAWKAMGVVDLNRRNYAAAIQAFQIALRSDDNDALSWLRLGEAYVGAGRHAAALKALQKSHELNPDDWVCTYQIGEVQRQTGQLAEAITSFESILKSHPDQIAVLMSLSESHLQLGKVEKTTGFVGRSVSSFLSSMLVAVDILKSSPGFRRLAWKTIVDCLVELSTFSSFTDQDYVAEVLLLVAGHLPKSSTSLFDGLVDQPIHIDSSTINGQTALKLALASCDFRLTFFSEEDGFGSAHFDLGVCLFRSSCQESSVSVKEKALRLAIENTRHALLADPGNSTYWSTFADMHFSSDPRISQHSYVKALDINSKDASIWTNLGLLYLHNNDLALANEALLRAQTLDPDYTLAWAGQGLVAMANGHDQDADALFEHAVSLSSDLPEADVEFSHRMFNKHSKSVKEGHKVNIQEVLLGPFFSLDRFCRRRTNDASALHLFALLCETLHLDESAIQHMTKSIEILEASYEETEDSVIERRYAIANANLGRMQLASGNIDSALETFEAAFGLLPSDDDEVVSLRALCRFGSGIAQTQLGNLQDAVASFEAALDIAEHNTAVRGQVAVMLAQTLWALGSDDFRESAKSQLLECISNDPQNLTAVIALAAMGLLTDDEALIDAALSEILSLPADARLRWDPEGDVESVLANHYLAEGQTDKASAVFQQAVHREPWRASQRRDLAALCVSEGNPQAAQALLTSLLDKSIVLELSELHHALRIVAIAMAQVTPDSSEEAQNIAQRSVMLAPWNTQNWQCLAYVRNLL